MKTKLIKTDLYLLLADEEAEISKTGTLIYENDTNLINITGVDYEPQGLDSKIIAYYPLKEAEELDLPLLPPFKEDEFSKYYQIVFDYVNSGIRNFGAMMALFKLKGIAQSKQFSLEDVEKAIEMAREYEFVRFGGGETEDKYTEEEIIKLLTTQKLPKFFIPEYEINKFSAYGHDTHILKTITNSEGKEELVGTYKY